jgi:hypothetical protein
VRSGTPGTCREREIYFGRVPWRSGRTYAFMRDCAAEVNKTRQLRAHSRRGHSRRRGAQASGCHGRSQGSGGGRSSTKSSGGGRSSWTTRHTPSCGRPPSVGGDAPVIYHDRSRYRPPRGPAAASPPRARRARTRAAISRTSSSSRASEGSATGILSSSGTCSRGSSLRWATSRETRPHPFRDDCGRNTALRLSFPARSDLLAELSRSSKAGGPFAVRKRTSASSIPSIPVEPKPDLRVTAVHIR